MTLRAVPLTRDEAIAFVAQREPIIWTGDAMSYAKAHIVAGILSVDAEGRVWRNFDAGRPIEPRRAENVGGKGYLRVSLWVPKLKRLAIVMAHRLVYETLVGQIPPDLEIDHRDGDKTNNRPDNLEPVTGRVNMQRSRARGRTAPWTYAARDGREWRDGRPVLTEEQRQLARAMRASGASLKRIAAELGIGTSHAHRITRGAA